LNAFFSAVQILLGDKSVIAKSISLTYSFVYLELDNQCLKEIVDYSSGGALGSEFDIRIVCEDSKLMIHERVFSARISGIYRRSVSRIESRFSFINLSNSQRQEIKKTILALKN
jgi:hypothetical protein